MQDSEFMLLEIQKACLFAIKSFPFVNLFHIPFISAIYLFYILFLFACAWKRPNLNTLFKHSNII